MTKILTTILFSTLLLWSFLAYGQTVDPATGTDGTAQVLALVQKLIDGVARGEWWPVAGAIVSLLTFGLRAGILSKLPWPGAVKWLNDNPLVAFTTPFVLSAVSGVISTFADGVPFSWMTFVSTTFKVGSMAVVSFVAAKNVQESRTFGKTEAAKVTTLVEANKDLLKP